ncbi:hypothetical protein [Fusobacterium pseudoperiodonticum]|uniref:hypothetical protein n=1 Tax=Fusobacterium pseudoperiodonticum TaxID=2663009 RepID=UPI0028D57D4D|nr:hypothetical protein [Fusobacterium pseudoperiodonticum]
MGKEINNIKNIKSYNNFSYHRYQKKENEKIEVFPNNFKSNEMVKDILNKKLRLIKN